MRRRAATRTYRLIPPSFFLGHRLRYRSGGVDERSSFAWSVGDFVTVVFAVWRDIIARMAVRLRTLAKRFTIIEKEK